LPVDKKAKRPQGLKNGYFCNFFVKKIKKSLTSCRRENTKKYIDELLCLFKKVLMLDAGENPQALSSLNCLLKNRSELNSLKKNCGDLIRFIQGCPDNVGQDDMPVIREAAEKIDKLCDEVSIDSKLLEQL